jgi:aromatic ring hydroxylase
MALEIEVLLKFGGDVGVDNESRQEGSQFCFDVVLPPWDRVLCCGAPRHTLTAIEIILKLSFADAIAINDNTVW